MINFGLVPVSFVVGSHGVNILPWTGSRFRAEKCALPVSIMVITSGPVSRRDVRVSGTSALRPGLTRLRLASTIVLVAASTVLVSAAPTTPASAIPAIVATPTSATEVVGPDGVDFRDHRVLESW